MEVGAEPHPREYTLVKIGICLYMPLLVPFKRRGWLWALEEIAVQMGGMMPLSEAHNRKYSWTILPHLLSARVLEFAT